MDTCPTGRNGYGYTGIPAGKAAAREQRSIRLRCFFVKEILGGLPVGQAGLDGDLYMFSVPSWHTPAGLEQYFCYYPIDASTAHIIRGFLSFYEAGFGELYLAKAKALADQITVRWIPPEIAATFGLTVCFTAVIP